MFLKALSVALVLGTLAVPSYAQTSSGGITGVVTDASGSVLPGVTVTLTNVATNATRVVQTNESGVYSMPALPPGVYSLKGELQGFRAVERGNIEIQVGSALRIPVTLEIGQMTDTVQVVADTPIIQTETASIGTVIENRSIVELPLNGRNYLQLASLIPGATTNGPSSSQGKQRMGGQRNSFALNVGGQRVHYNHYSLDGVENTDLNFNSYMLLPSVDALQEFNVVSGLFDAEYGRAIAQVNASHQIGNQQAARHGVRVHAQFRARCQELLRSARQAHPAVQAQRSTLGSTVVLPKVVDGRNKLFFMFNWEGLRENKALTQNPAAADRLAHRRLLRPARRQRQSDPDLRSGDARVRRRRQRAAGADAVPRQHHPGESHSSGLAKAAGLLAAPEPGADGPQLPQQRSTPDRHRPVYVSPRLHPEREIELVLPA